MPSVLIFLVIQAKYQEKMSVKAKLTVLGWNMCIRVCILSLGSNLHNTHYSNLKKLR